MTAPFPSLVLAALDAADVAPDSEAGRIALDRAPDVGIAVNRAESYRAYYRSARFPVPTCPQLAAVNLVLLAMAEASRGVRVVSTSRAKP